MPNCDICGAPMPPGEEMFKFHGYSGPCPRPPLPTQPPQTELGKLLKVIVQSIGGEQPMLFAKVDIAKAIQQADASAVTTPQ